MDLTFKQAANYILKNYGHDILLQRRLWGVERGPFELATPNTSNGFSPKLERWTVRDFYARHSGMSAIATENHEGVTRAPELIYYFPTEANPKEGDRIYEIDKRFNQNFTTFMIEYAQPMRGKGGRIAYWACGVMREYIQNP